MNRFFAVVNIAALALGLTACSSTTSPAAPTSVAAATGSIDVTQPAPSVVNSAAGARPGELTIVGIVLQDDGEFDVLQAAVVRAGLVDALNGPSQKTVFAPTDLAFVTTLKAADEGAAIAAVEKMPIETLTDILLFHVTQGRRTSRSVLASPSYQMLNGDKLTRTQLSAAGFVATDVSASNGIVHVINAVLLPTS